MKKNYNVKRILAATLSIMTAFSMMPVQAIHAAESIRPVIYIAGAGSKTEINTEYFTVNGDLFTDHNIILNALTSNLNGSTVTDEEADMFFARENIVEDYFYSNDATEYYSDYSDSTLNLSIKTPVYSDRKVTVTENAVLKSAVFAGGDIEFDGSLNATNSLLYSGSGDIILSSDNINYSGIIYAPYGEVIIDSDNFSFNGIIVANSLTIQASNVNMNYSNAYASFIDTYNNIPDPEAFEEDPDEIDIGEIYYWDVTDPSEIEYDGSGLYYVKNQLLLTASSAADFETVQALADEWDADIVGYIELTNDYQLKFRSEMTLNDLYDVMNYLMDVDYVEFVSLNTMIDSDEDFTAADELWDSSREGTWDEVNHTGLNWGAEAVHMGSAIDSIDYNALYDVKIGVLDGVFTTHEDLNWTRLYNNTIPTVSTVVADNADNSHGTHVAGTMAATYANGLGIFGTSIRNRLYGFSLEGNTIDGISGMKSVMKVKYALAILIGNNVRAINYSQNNGHQAGFGASHGNTNAINYLNTNAKILETFLLKMINSGYNFVIVPSAGNTDDMKFVAYADPSTDEINNLEYASRRYGYIKYKDYKSVTGVDPSTLPSSSILKGGSLAEMNSFLNYIKNRKVMDRIICVGSMDSSINKAASSCEGSRVDIYAPGVDILSCVVRNGNKNNAVPGFSNYDTMSGTSMAAPHVTGAVGLCESINPTISAADIKSIILNHSTSATIGGVSASYLNVEDAVDTMSRTTKSVVALDQTNGIAIGQVVNEDGDPLEDVRVTAVQINANGVTSSSNQKVVTTDATGHYELVLPAGEYSLEFEKLLYLGTTLDFTSYPEETTYLDKVTLFDEGLFSGVFLSVHGNVTDAMTGNNVSGATVKFRSGWNNKRGAYVKNLLGNTKTATTNSSGNYSESLEVGAYTAEISKSGYITGYSNIVVSRNAGTQYATITPVLSDGEFRVVLTWGAVPSDLDSHLVCTIGSTTKEIYYHDKTFSYGGNVVAQLDHDDTTSYGPETVTITWSDEIKNCSYFVHDYSNRNNSSSTQMSYSSATVKLYKGNQLLRTYLVPVGQAGTKWNVFKIENGVPVTVNTIS